MYRLGSGYTDESVQVKQHKKGMFRVFDSTPKGALSGISIF